MNPEFEDRLRDQLVRQEGLRLKPYRDSVGKLTIGVGRNLDDVGLSTPEVMYLLDRDIGAAVATLNRNLAVYAALSDARQCVLVNMCFNMGWIALAGFRKFLLCVAAGDYAEASREMLASEWAHQVGERAIELADQMKNGFFVVLKA